MTIADDQVAIYLNCEGLGDCLFAIPVLRKLRSTVTAAQKFVLFTHHPALFADCPAVFEARPYAQAPTTPPAHWLEMFDVKKFSHAHIDTMDFMSLPLGLGQLSFREKQLEYFPQEPDCASRFDVVLNTSTSWPSRSWPLENWQQLADRLLALGCSVAVVGKTVASPADGMLKHSAGLRGCTDLTNVLSLDQTYFTIARAGLFITCQNGLSVLSGATDTEVMVLDMSIEWSKRAIYRQQNPHYKVTYVPGDCSIYCCSAFACPEYESFRCIPPLERVLAVAARKLGAAPQAGRAQAGLIRPASHPNPHD